MKRAIAVVAAVLVMLTVAAARPKCDDDGDGDGDRDDRHCGTAASTTTSTTMQMESPPFATPKWCATPSDVEVACAWAMRQFRLVGPCRLARRGERCDRRYFKFVNP